MVRYREGIGGVASDARLADVYPRPFVGGAEAGKWAGWGGEAAEGDEEIGGSEGAKERRRASGLERRGEGAQLGCSVVRRLAREHPERAPGRPGAGGRAGMVCAAADPAFLRAACGLH